MQKARIKPESVRPKTITIPGSKSFTNRALIIASLAKGKSLLKNPLYSDDTKVMIQALKQLGVSIQKNDDDNLIVEGKGGIFNEPKKPIYIGNAGTAMRFLTALASLPEHGKNKNYRRQSNATTPHKGFGQSPPHYGSENQYR